MRPSFPVPAGVAFLGKRAASWLLAGIVGLSLTASCSGAATTKPTTNDGGASDGALGSHVCAPGQQISCACLGGGSGIQICDVGGESYGLCVGCPGASASLASVASSGSLSSSGSPPTSTSSGSDATGPRDAGRDAPHHDGGRDAAHGGDAADGAADATPCDAGGPPPPRLPRTCIIYPAGADDGNECDGHHDPASPFPANGTEGNGFDDNCNGLVDEGCACPDVGAMKPCFLVPAGQSEHGRPVGWCATNSVGAMACTPAGWSGVCRGAAPAFTADVCAAGDFDCDGTPMDAPGGCGCQPPPAVVCPTAPLVMAPYPPASTLPVAVDASAWFADPAAVATATNWQWSLVGGDCDDILPNATFALFPDANGLGAVSYTESTTLGPSTHEHGIVLKGSTGQVLSSVYPAFTMSGAYVLTGSWEVGGASYACSVQIQVRAPGVRAEACWSTAGEGDDLDLHMAKVNGFTTACPATMGWSDLACATGNEDCYYGDCYAADGNDTANWGYAASPLASCAGWGGQTGSGATSCGNPRLDRDTNGISGACVPAIKDPANPTFCGPENINVDAPQDGDQFALAVRFYTQKATGATASAHVNVYCDGDEILSTGYDPTPGPDGQPVSDFPRLLTAGGDSTGDMWKVGLVTASVGDGGSVRCKVASTRSKVADTTRDGTTAFCVDNDTSNGASSQSLLDKSGGVPGSANALCFH